MLHALMLTAAWAAQQFTALSLPAAIERALTNAPGVAQARARVDESAALLAAARSGGAPALTANYAASPQAGANNATVIQQLTTVGAQLTLGETLASAPLVREAAFALKSAQFDLLDAQRTERQKTVRAYFGALQALATLQLRREELAGTRSDLRAAQTRYRAGDAPRLDVVRAQVALSGAQAALDAAVVDTQNSADALASETGVSASLFANVQNAGAALPEAPGVAQAVRRALANRADLASALQAVAGAQAALDASRRAALPSVTIAGGYTTGIDTGIHVQGPSANITVSVPVSRAAAYRSQAESARLLQAQAKASGIRRQIAFDAAAAARTYLETIRAQTAASGARAAAQDELRATQIGYRSGASSSLDVADARRTYVQAALNEVAAIYARAQAAALLQQEIGP